LSTSTDSRPPPSAAASASKHHRPPALSALSRRAEDPIEFRSVNAVVGRARLHPVHARASSTADQIFGRSPRDVSSTRTTSSPRRRSAVP
jgi:hypothetical protein